MLDLRPRLNSTRETLLLVNLNNLFHIGGPPDYFHSSNDLRLD